MDPINRNKNNYMHRKFKPIHRKFSILSKKQQVSIKYILMDTLRCVRCSFALYKDAKRNKVLFMDGIINNWLQFCFGIFIK